MGTVHAKAPEVRESDVVLNRVRARVDKVHIEGVSRTKEDILKKAVSELFQARNFEQVVMKARFVRKQLESIGAFKHIGILIDTSKGPEASPHGLEVTFYTLEMKRVVGGVNTLVGNNEGSMVVGIKMPNVFGRGEFIQTEYHYGTKHSTGFNITASKPILGPLNPRVTAAIFQQAADFPWSGFRQMDRGLLSEFMFESAPGIHHSLRWEGLWRELSCLSLSAPFDVREEMGHSLKSAIKHVVTIDGRNDPILPSTGGYFRLQQELAGLGGDIGFLKHELEYQLNIPLNEDVVVQSTLLAGHMKGIGQNKSFNICDRFFLGGPLSLRGFQLRGVGPHAEGQSLGGEAYWAGGLHIYTPLPFKPGRGGIGDYFRTHTFITAGNMDNFRFDEDFKKTLALLVERMRWSIGAGIVLSVGRVARFELNYCIPMKAQSGDRINPGVQFGVGVSFL